MYPTFQGHVRDGQLVVDELSARGEQMLAGKQVAVVVLERPDAGEAGGQVWSGVYGDTAGKLGALEGRDAFVIVRDDLSPTGEADAFDQKFQLGGKIGDLDT